MAESMLIVSSPATDSLKDPEWKEYFVIERRLFGFERPNQLKSDLSSTYIFPKSSGCGSSSTDTSITYVLTINSTCIGIPLFLTSWERYYIYCCNRELSNAREKAKTDVAHCFTSWKWSRATRVQLQLYHGLPSVWSKQMTFRGDKGFWVQTLLGVRQHVI